LHDGIADSLYVLLPFWEPARRKWEACLLGRMAIFQTPAGLASHGSKPMSGAAGRLRRFGPVHMTPGYLFKGRSFS
jgi:hypothetical protein